jgi:hypothetical protein
MDNTLCCDYGEDAGCRFLDTGFIKVIIFFYPASSIQYPVSATLWNKRSFSKFCLFLVPACPGYVVSKCAFRGGI